MKHFAKYILSAAAVVVFGSCNKWLDIMPEDTTTEKQLFSNAGGYHSAINGMYQSMASSSLYGQNLTWGFASALSQYYDNAALDNDKNFSYTEKYDYESDEMRAYGEQIWTTAYNVIANANNLLGHLSQADNALFPDYEKGEVDIIKGEALAIRALMHFDLLRLFAVAPVVDGNAKAIPYVETYPSFFNERKTVNEVLAKVTEDMEEAAELLGKVDTTDIGSTWMEYTNNRYMVSNSAQNYFLTGRGVRLNFIGVKSLLARVKAYAGDISGAYDEAKVVIDGYVDKNQWYKYVGFSSSDSEDGRSHKMLDELLVSFYYENLATDYTSVVSRTKDQSSYALKNLSGIFADNDDYRQNKLVVTYDVNTKVSLKYFERSGSSSSIVAENKVLPVMRLSELHLIEAEYLAFVQNDIPGAVGVLNELRANRGCMRQLDTAMSEEEFKSALNAEVWRENVAEGQYFFYCKRINAPTINNNGVAVPMDGKYTMRIPDSEVSLN